MDKNIQTAFRCFTLGFIIVILVLATEQFVLRRWITHQPYNDKKLLESINELVSAGVLSKSSDGYFAKLNKKRLSRYLSNSGYSMRRRRAIYMQLVQADRQGAIIVEKGQIKFAKGTTNISNPHITMVSRKRKRGKFLDCNYEIIADSVADERGHYSRVYPFGPELFNVIGYSNISYGNRRLENIYNDLLMGKQKRKWYLLFRKFRSSEADVVLTINSQLQKSVYAALKEHNGAIVVLDVNTGAILAMVSKPSFDPASPVGRGWMRAERDRKSKLFHNRAFEEIYPPGSTFKIVTASAALMEPGVINPQKTILCNGYHKKYNVRCHLKHGEVDLSKALMLSCNVYFSDIAHQLGKDKLRKYASKFGFGIDRQHPHFFDLLSDKARRLASYGDEQAEKGLWTASSYSVPYEFPPYPGLIAQSGIGQYEVRATPLQLAMVAAAIANKGTVMKPCLVKEIRNSPVVNGVRSESSAVGESGSPQRYQPGDIIKTYSPQQFGQAVPPEVATEVAKMMMGVIESGTGKWLKRIYKTEEGEYIAARKAEGTEILVAGKTGTAETDKSKPSHSWFVAFAPADNPRIAICVLAEQAGWGAAVAGPIAMEVLATALNHAD